MTARRIRTEGDLRRLSPAEQEARVRAAEALQELRNHPRLTLEAAAHRKKDGASELEIVIVESI